MEVAEGPLGKVLGMRFRKEGRMLFRFKRGKPVIDMFLVRTNLQLYFIRDGKVSEVLEAERTGLNPRKWFYRPEKPADMLLESSDDLGLREGDEVRVK